MITKARRSQITAACLAMVVLAVPAQPLAAVSPAIVNLAALYKDKPQKEKPYALIFGTAFGPNDRPLYGVKVKIRPQKKKHPSWDLMSDHRGEFAQRVPPGPGDYLIHGEAEYAPVGEDGKPQLSKKMRLKGDAKVHVENEERLDITLHLTE